MHKVKASFILSFIFLLISIALLITGIIFLRNDTYAQYKLKQDCDKAQSDMKSSTKGSKCLIWSDSQCVNGVYDGTTCQTKTNVVSTVLLISSGISFLIFLALIFNGIRFYKIDDYYYYQPWSAQERQEKASRVVEQHNRDFINNKAWSAYQPE